MAVEFDDVRAVDGQPDWWALVGMSGDQWIEHRFPTVTLQWRAAEYGVDPTDIDTLFDIIFNEALELTLPFDIESVKAHPNPYDHEPEEALSLKKQHMTKIKDKQTKARQGIREVVKMDRVHLAAKLAGLLPDLSGVVLEDKKLRRMIIDPGIKREAERLFAASNDIRTAELAIEGARIHVEKGMPLTDITAEVIENVRNNPASGGARQGDEGDPTSIERRDS